MGEKIVEIFFVSEEDIIGMRVKDVYFECKEEGFWSVDVENVVEVFVVNNYKEEDL